ncbi:MAG: hypothetical protein ACRC2R_26415 [Xenococcaceae cyanobacterium]
MALIYPSHFRILQREVDGWTIDRGRVFYNHSGREYNFNEDWIKYGVTKQKLVIELFRQYGGKLGYYLANLRDKKYYYCGLTDEDIQQTLYSLGIGKKESDPHV